MCNHGDTPSHGPSGRVDEVSCATTALAGAGAAVGIGGSAVGEPSASAAGVAKSSKIGTWNPSRGDDSSLLRMFC
jgi:hypothetical protein